MLVSVSQNHRFGSSSRETTRTSPACELHREPVVHWARTCTLVRNKSPHDHLTQKTAFCNGPVLLSKSPLKSFSLEQGIIPPLMFSKSSPFNLSSKA